MNKFIKSLIIINGLIIPIVILIFIFTFLRDQYRFKNLDVNSGGVNINNVIIKDQDTLLLQGLNYSEPSSIYNSTNYFIDVISKTYEVAHKIEKRRSSFDPEVPEYYGPEDLLNILFLDQSFNPIRKLVTRKASIIDNSLQRRHWDGEIDSSIKNIFYLISFIDSNNDGLIDYKDQHDLYITDLNGNNLTQITKGVEIKSYEIIDQGDNVLISYYDSSSERQEYKLLKFAIYNIALNELQYLSKIDQEIKEINKIMIKK